MNLRPVFHRAVLVPLFVIAAPLAAQNVLIVEHDGKPCLVRSARGLRPCIEIGGKLEAVVGNRYAFKKVPEYLPTFIAVRNLAVRTRYLTLDGAGQLNNELDFNARLETAYLLDDVFVVLEMDTDSAGKVLFLHEVGRLEPRAPRTISLIVPLTGSLGSGKFQLHLFSSGLEVLHSEIPAMYREAVVDRMTAKRIASTRDTAPTVFFGPVPEYPPALLKAKIEGQAVISLRIGANGRVYDPAVKSASDPAFGVTALAAVRLWRFLPRVKGGHPVETLVDLPINFTPPEMPVEKS